LKAVPFVVPKSVAPLLAFRERVGASRGLPSRGRIGGGPLPLVLAGHLFEELARELDDEAVGLAIGEAARFEDTPLGRRVAGSPTVGAALAAAAAASAQYCAGQLLRVTQRGDEVWLERRHAGALRQGRRQANDFALLMLIDLLRRAAGPRWRPTALLFEGPAPGHAEQLAALASHSAQFGAIADRLVFPTSVLAMALPSSAAGPVPAALPDLDFEASVRRTIQCLLEAGELSLQNVAEAAGTGPRSLQRSLAGSGLSFARLVDEARFRTASGLLRDPAIRVTDISIALGYRDAANFTRAFRRWAGVSPVAFRRAAETQLDQRTR